MSQLSKPYLLATLLCLAGCGGGGSSAPSGTTGPSSSSSVTIPPPAPSTVGRVIFNSVLLRAIPSNIDTLVFRGLDAQGTAVFGPVSQPKAATIVLENVPVSVRTLEIAYLEGEVVRGRASQPVQVSPGQDTQIQDPNFSDVTYALTQIRLDPTSVELRRGQTAPLRVQGSYADNTSTDLTASAEWTSSNTSVAESVGGIVVARGVGNCTLTATVGGQSSQASVQVNKPLLQELQVSPVNASLLEGGQLTFQAVGTFEDGTQETAANAVWSSSAPNIASITPEGSARALTPGESLIQATLDGMTSNTTLTVAVNETLTNLVLSPSQIQVPKGMSLGYTASASYANGTTTEVTSSTRFESENENIAQFGDNFQVQPGLPSLVVYNRYPGLADPPPPYFPFDVFQLRAIGLGSTRVFGYLENLAAEAWVTVIHAVPKEARVQPVQTHLLEVGGQLQLETLAALTDGAQETGRSDISISQQGQSTQIDGQQLLRAVQPGVDRLEAVFLPCHHYQDQPATAIKGADSNMANWTFSQLPMNKRWWSSTAHGASPSPLNRCSPE